MCLSFFSLRIIISSFSRLPKNVRTPLSCNFFVVYRECTLILKEPYALQNIIRTYSTNLRTRTISNVQSCTC